MNTFTIIAIVVPMSCAIGASLYLINRQGNTIVDLKKEIASLHKQIDDNDTQVANSIRKVDISINETRNKLQLVTDKIGEINQPVWNELDRFGITDEAYLPPQSKGSARVISTTWGKVAISFHDILPYANGSKVTAKFMNLSGIAFSDCKLSGTGIATTNSDEPMTRDSDDSTATLEVGRPKFASFLIPDIPPSKFEMLKASVHGCNVVPVWK